MTNTGNEQIYAQVTVNRIADYPDGIKSQIINDSNGNTSNIAGNIINGILPYSEFPNASAALSWIHLYVWKRNQVFIILFSGN